MLPSKVIGYDLDDCWFDIGMALYHWLSHNYGGQNCEKYAAMCSLNAQNLPDIFDGSEPLAAMIYDDINENNWQQALKAWHKYDHET